MKCPCGCGGEVPNLCFFATKKCSKKANKLGIFMPRNGAWRADTRIYRKVKALKKGMR